MKLKEIEPIPVTQLESRTKERTTITEANQEDIITTITRFVDAQQTVLSQFHADRPC